MFQFPIHGYSQVVEISVARELFYRLGCGMRRIDGEKLDVFVNLGEMGFYVSPKETENPLLGRLAVDEGTWTGAIHRVTSDSRDVPDSILTNDGISKPWNEYVDFTGVLRLCVNKLVPDAVIAKCHMMGRGSRDQHFCAEYMRVLTAWNVVNKDLIKVRDELQDQVADLIKSYPGELSSQGAAEQARAKEKLSSMPRANRYVDFVLTPRRSHGIISTTNRAA